MSVSASMFFIILRHWVSSDWGLLVPVFFATFFFWLNFFLFRPTDPKSGNVFDSKRDKNGLFCGWREQAPGQLVSTKVYKIQNTFNFTCLVCSFLLLEPRSTGTLRYGCESTAAAISEAKQCCDWFKIR